ncbi:MAG: AAA family ATPase [Candidatus Bipolaricaulota bacterium]
MNKLYVAAVEEKAGKTFLAVGLCRALAARGGTCSYCKPVGRANIYRQGRPFDRDGEVVAQALGLSVPEELVGLVGGELPRSWTPPAGAWERIESLAQGTADVLVLEGREWLGRGMFSGLWDATLAAHLEAPLLLVARYRGESTVDQVLTASRLVGDDAQLLGVVLNEVSVDTELEEVRAYVAPYLEETGIPVLGVVPFERRLRAVRIGHLVEALGGELLVTGVLDAEVERFLVGAMREESALRHMRRIPGQLAVVTGGDRTDIQSAALAVPRVRALILTGGLRPERAVLTEAAERNVTVVLVAQDTMTVAEGAERLVGRAPLGSDQLALVDGLIADGLELDRVLELLG